MNNQDALGDEQFVKQEYPDAWVQDSRVFNQWTVYEFKFPANTVVAHGKTREEAWQAAASRLRAGEGQPLERECVFCGFKWFPKIDDEPCPHHDELHNTKPTSSPLGRQDEHPSGYDNPLTMDRILQLAHVLCKCPPEYRSSWSCDPCRAFAELIFFRQSAATPVSVGGEDTKK